MTNNNDWKDGIPPVGIDCLVCLSGLNDEYFVTKPIAYYGDSVWLDGLGVWEVEPLRFKPIKTKADIEREQAIEEMKSSSICSKVFSDHLCRDLHDAGYRKQGEIISSYDFVRDYIESGCSTLTDFVEDYTINPKVKT